MKRYDLWLCSLTIFMIAAAGPTYGGVSKDSGKTGDSAVSQDKPADSTMGKGAGTGTPKVADKPKDKHVDLTGGQSGIPEEYSTTPVRQGRLKDVLDSPWIDKPAKNAKGETLGTIKKVLKDTETDKVEYVILAIANSKDQRPVAWSKFQEKGNQLTLNSTKEELMGRADPKDMSPDISQYMHDIEKTRAEPKQATTKKDRKLGKKDNIALQPEAGGIHGEDTTPSGGGQDGPKALPPGEAPGFKHEGDKGKK